METILLGISVFIFISALALNRAPFWVWSIFVGAGTVMLSLFWHWGWLVGGGLLLAFNIPQIRQNLLSASILKMMQRKLPPISKTEEEALAAGSVCWDAELFSGKPNWDHLLQQPKSTLKPEEIEFINGPVDELCRRLNDWQITNQDHDLSPEVWSFIKDNGFFGMIIPKSYGGLGFSTSAHSAVIMKVASRSITAAVTIMVPNSLGPAELLLHYGTKDQKSFYLPRLAKGIEIPCFALTSADAGSDAASMPDRGEVCYQHWQGERRLGIRLNWAKRYITLGPVATLLGLAFRLDDPQHFIGGKQELGITCALIPTNTPGITIGSRHAPLDQCFQNGPNRGVNVFIPIEWVIGGVEQVGHGWSMLMQSLAAGRGISLPALSCGAAKLSAMSVGAYSRVREQFGLPIGRFEGVSEALARIGGESYAMDAVRQLTCQFLDRGEQPSVVTAIAKYHMTERMRRVVNDGMDILAGKGISLGPKNYLGRLYQAIPVSITVEGANILTRNLMIFGQGALRCHPWLRQEMQACAEPNHQKALKSFDTAFSGHLKDHLSHWIRAPLLMLTPLGQKGEKGSYIPQLNRLSAALALCSEVALITLGGGLKRHEHLSARLGDILSQLYIASAVIKHFNDNGRDEDERPLMQWAVDDALYRGGEALEQFIRHLPSRSWALPLRVLLIPFGNPWETPHDRLLKKVSALLLKPSSVRQRLISGIYLPTKGGEPLADLERALQRTVQLAPISKKVKKSLHQRPISLLGWLEKLHEVYRRGVITEKELAQLKELDSLRQRVIRVDDFPADYWQSEPLGGYAHGQQKHA